MSYLNNKITTAWKELKETMKLKKEYKNGYWEQKCNNQIYFLLGFLSALKQIRGRKHDS
tara:strand:+ start:38 stop:214 length:177 start_codon:yes stop_codon:yes gene_type:complete